MLERANRVSLGAVHTHTHTGTFRKIERVANEATLYCVKNRLCIALYEVKSMVQEIGCFSRCLKIFPTGKVLSNSYTNLKLLNELERQGGVA